MTKSQLGLEPLHQQIHCYKTELFRHKSFEGIHDKTHFNHAHATRKFLHYFIHECGHALGLTHPFELGKKLCILEFFCFHSYMTKIFGKYHTLLQVHVS